MSISNDLAQIGGSPHLKSMMELYTQLWRPFPSNSIYFVRFGAPSSSLVRRLPRTLLASVVGDSNKSSVILRCIVSSEDMI